MKCVFKTTAEEWLEWKSLSVKASTYSGYSSIIKHHLIPEFGSTVIVDITPGDVQSFLTNRKITALSNNKGELLSSATLRSILTVLKSIMWYAKQQKSIPVCDLGGLTVRCIKKPACTLDHYKQATLTKYLLDNPTNVNVGIMICLYGGLRIGEICALKWSEVSSDCKCINICKTMQRIQIPNPESDGQKTKIIIEKPKSVYSIRIVPIPDILAGIMCEMRQDPGTYVLTGAQKYIEPRTFENHIYRALQRCEIKNASAHTLRHSYATRSIELGSDMKTVSELLGHSSVKVTMDIYVHSSMELKKSNADRLNKLLTIK